MQFQEDTRTFASRIKRCRQIITDRWQNATVLRQSLAFIPGTPKYADRTEHSLWYALAPECQLKVLRHSSAFLLNTRINGTARALYRTLFLIQVTVLGFSYLYASRRSQIFYRAAGCLQTLSLLPPLRTTLLGSPKFQYRIDLSKSHTFWVTYDTQGHIVKLHIACRYTQAKITMHIILNSKKITIIFSGW